MGGLGSLYLISPEAIRDAAGLSPESSSALTEVRSTYGGLHVGVALFLVTCASSASRRRAGLLFCGLAFACAGLARVAGIVEFDSPELAQAVTAGLEIGFSAIALWLYRSLPTP
jgi:hypothetical protein